MEKIRVGRVIVDGEIRYITLPSRDEYPFEFSRYKNIVNPIDHSPENCEGSVVCRDRETYSNFDDYERFPPKQRELYDRLEGHETQYAEIKSTNGYVPVQVQLDVIADTEMLYSHPDLESITSQLGVSSLTPLLEAEALGVETSEGKIEAEVYRMKDSAGRTASFERPILIDGKTYLLEVKGASYGDRPLELESEWDIQSECNGGLKRKRAEHSMEMIRHLNVNGYESVILVAAYGLPGLKDSGQDELGAYVRAVKATPTLAHYVEVMPQVAESLEMSKEELAEYIVREATKDMAIIWKSGIIHNGPVHEQNMRIGSITDFTGSDYVRNVGFKGLARDVATFVSSCEQTVFRIYKEDVEYPSEEFYRTNRKEAERLEILADRELEELRAQCKISAREIISDEINKQLGLKLPSITGTTTMAAEIYDVQRQLGLTDPNERPVVEYTSGRSERYCIFFKREEPNVHLQLEDLKLKENVD